MAYADTPEGREKERLQRERNAAKPERREAHRLRNIAYRERLRADPERAAVRAEKDRQRVAARTEAQREKVRERDRKRRAEMTPEQREARQARRRSKRKVSTLSPEQQARRREQNREACRRWREKKTAEAGLQGITFEALRQRQRRANWTEEQWAEHRRKHREYQARRWAEDPQDAPWREAYRRGYRLRFARTTPQQRREQRVRKLRLDMATGRASPAAAASPGASFPACAAPTPERDLLVRLLAAVRPCEDRDDIVGQAAILILEGTPFAEAVREARRTVMREVGFLRHATRPIDECYFL